MTRAAGGNLLALSLATAISVAAQAADEIKSGKWEFTTQMQLPGAVQSAPSGQAAGGNAPMTRIACIDAANPIPAETQCKVDQVDRRGSLVTWAMTCNSPRGEIHSAGSARYAGNTMEGTVTARVPGPNGQPVDAPGYIAGRYPSHLAMPNSGVRRYAAALQSLVSAGARDRLARAEEPVVRRLCAGGRWIRTFGSAPNPLPFSETAVPSPMTVDGLVTGTRNRKSESISLQRGVKCEPAFAGTNWADVNRRIIITRVDDRRILNGIFWVLRSGAPWRDLSNMDVDQTCRRSK